MKLTILCVGKIKEKFFRDALSEYLKRMTRYAKIDVVEVSDEKTPDQASEREEAQIKDKEAARMERYLRDDDYVIALAIDGKQMDSVDFSKKLKAFGVNGTGNIVFVIGGSLGIADSILRRADEKISFSKMTFPHQLMRVILLEQIYRAYRIMRNEPYHK